MSCGVKSQVSGWRPPAMSTETSRGMREQRRPPTSHCAPSPHCPSAEREPLLTQTSLPGPEPLPPGRSWNVGSPWSPSLGTRPLPGLSLLS